MIRKQVLQFVAKNGSATRLKNNDRNAGIDGLRKDFDNALEVLLGSIEHSEIVERTPAAGLPGRNRHSEAGIHEDAERGLDCFGMKIVVEGVHPQDDLASACRRLWACGLAAILPSRLQEAGRREPGNLALRGQAQRASQNVAKAWRVT